MEYRKLIVEATGKARREDDREVPGRYVVEVDASLSDPDAASCALDVFHFNVAVKELERFAFAVLDGGRELDENPEHDSYSLDDRGRLVGKEGD